MQYLCSAKCLPWTWAKALLLSLLKKSLPSLTYIACEHSEMRLPLLQQYNLIRRARVLRVADSIDERFRPLPYLLVDIAAQTLLHYLPVPA